MLGWWRECWFVDLDLRRIKRLLACRLGVYSYELVDSFVFIYWFGIEL